MHSCMIVHHHDGRGAFSILHGGRNEGGLMFHWLVVGWENVFIWFIVVWVYCCLEDDDDGSVGDDDDRRRASATDLAWRVVWCGVMWLVLLLEMV